MSGNFIGYLLGYIIAIIGVGYGLNAAGIPREWIIAAVLVMIGLGIVYALSHSQRDRPIHSSHSERVIERDSNAPTRSTVDRY